MVDQKVRLNWVGELAKEMPDRVKLVDEQYGNWVTEEAQSVTEDWFQRYPEMNAVAAGNDEMALGVANVVESAGKSFDDFYLVASGGWDLGTQLVKEGKMDMTIRIDTVQTEIEMLDNALAKYRGEFEDKIFQYSTAAFYPIDKSNA